MKRARDQDEEWDDWSHERREDDGEEWEEDDGALFNRTLDFAHTILPQDEMLSLVEHPPSNNSNTSSNQVNVGKGEMREARDGEFVLPFAPNCDVTQQRPTYQVVDNVSYYNTVSLMTLLYANASEGISTPAIFDFTKKSMTTTNLNFKF